MQDIQAGLEKAIRVTMIAIDAAEKKDLLSQLDAYLDWLKPLLTLDTGSFEPLLVNHDSKNVMREDMAMQDDLAAIQEAAPNFEDCYYPVPRIIE